MLFLIGCYTRGNGGEGRGIVAARSGPDGVLSVSGESAPTPSPTFLARHPTLPVVYAVNEVDDGRLTAFEVDPDGRLREIGGQPTGGAAPCHVAVWPDGRFALCANYGSGSVSVHALGADGAVGERTDLVRHRGAGPDPRRQEGPHAHMVRPDPDGAAVSVVDLGTDAIHRYALDGAAGTLRPAAEPLRTPPGSGPRHLAWGPDGRCYVAGELDGAVITYDVGGEGGPRELGRVAVTTGAGPVQPSEIAVSADGRFLYLANRGPDTISVFTLHDTLPRYLTEVGAGGRWPRHFAMHAGLLYVANERSHSVVTFRVDRATGVPSPTGAVLRTPSPTCVLALG